MNYLSRLNWALYRYKDDFNTDSIGMNALCLSYPEDRSCVFEETSHSLKEQYIRLLIICSKIGLEKHSMARAEVTHG
jgi:hypothetical protein